MGAEFYLILDTVDVVLPGFEEDLDMEDVEEGNYASIDRIESHESYWHMEDFTAGLPEGEARSRLEQALIRSKPFRHFKDALEVFPPSSARPGTRSRTKLVIEWLIDVKAIEDPGPKAEGPTA